MSKRGAENLEGLPNSSLKSGERPFNPTKENDVEAAEGNFEDEFEDDFESEEEIIEAGVDGRPDEERETEEKRDAMDIDHRTFIPGRDKLQKGEHLMPDTSVYELLHGLSTTWPCLSFDILRDSLGDDRKSYPATIYAVAGTQAESRRANDNELLVLKLSGLSRVDRGDGGSSDSDDDEGEDDEASDPILETRSLRLPCTTNRIRAHQIPPSGSSRHPTTYTATMLENTQLQIHNVTPHLTSFDVPGTIINPQQSRPVATLTQHRTEGYAIAWSPLFPQGRLLSGDNEGKIYLTSGSNSDASSTSIKWTTDSRPFMGHTSSVEDLAWSPNERHVFASASSDGTVRIWDSRSKSRTSAICVSVSSHDVNVLSWSKLMPNLLATGDDDGVWAVWNLEQWKSLTGNSKSQGGNDKHVYEAPKPIASFPFHKEQITSLEWHPTDSSAMAVAAADNTVTIWDLAVELDEEEAGSGGGGSSVDPGMRDVPPQLMFVHYADSVKECHWHPQIPGVVMATGGEGFGVFKGIMEEGQTR